MVMAMMMTVMMVMVMIMEINEIMEYDNEAMTMVITAFFWTLSQA